MKKAVLILLLAIALFSFLIRKNEDEPVSSDKFIRNDQAFYQPENFAKAINSAKKIPTENEVEIIIVPHHLLAADLIAQALKKAQGKKVDNLFIVGPNHYNAGNKKIATTDADWQTARGMVLSDKELVKNLEQELGTNNKMEIFEKEHSIGAIVPFANYYFSEAKIIPIIYHSNIEFKEIGRVVEWLKKRPRNSLIIVSTDFSHYLEKRQAEEKDKLTESMIEKKEIDQIFQLSNDHLDSPPSLITALMLANDENLKITKLAHANSADYLFTDANAKTTSYFTYCISR